MSNLEDVFLKINQEFAPDLFGDLKGFDDSKANSSMGSNSKQPNYGIGASQSDSRDTEIANAIKDNSGSGSDSDEVNNSADDSNDKDYELDPDNAENLIRGSSCVRSCSASSAKRFIIYKRDWCGLICQIVIPLILVLFGLWLTSGPSKL